MISRLLEHPVLKKLFPFAFFPPLCAIALGWLSRRDLEFSPEHIAGGRLALCAWVVLAAAALAGLVSLIKALMAGQGARLRPAGLRAWLSAQRPAVWARAAGLSALFCLLPTLLAEDFARALEGLAPFSFLRWLPVFLACLTLYTPLFRFAKVSAACRYAIACLPAVSLPVCRWFARYDDDTKLVVALFVLAVFSLGLRACAKGELARFVPNVKLGALFGIATLGCAFLWVYNKIVYDARTITFGVGGVIFLLLVLAAMACLGLSLLAFFTWLQEHWQARPAQSTPARFNIRLFAGLFGILAAVWLLWWWAYRPGNFSADSIHQWTQALAPERLEDSHPILSTLWMVPFAQISASPALFTAVQTLLCAAAFAAILAWWNRQGIPAKLCLGLAVFLALLPAMGIYVVTVWKDVTFCMGVLWLAFLLARLASGQRPSRSFAVEAALALLVVACFRHNGIVVAALSALVLLGMGLRQRAKQAVAGVLAGLALVVFVQGPLYSILGVSHYSMGLSGLGASSVGSAYTYGVDLPEDVAQMAEAAAPKEEWVKNYSPSNYFGYFNQTLVTDENPFFAPFQEKGSLWVVGMWLRMFVRSPLVMFQERMSMCDSLLFVDKSAHPQAFIYPYHNRVYENQLGLAHSDSALLRFFDGVLEWTEDTTPRLAVFWRCGVWWMVCLWLVYFNFLQKRGRRSWYFVPMLANVLTLVLALTEQGYRYTWVVIPYVLFGLLLAVMPAKAKDEAAKKETQA